MTAGPAEALTTGPDTKDGAAAAVPDNRTTYPRRHLADVFMIPSYT
jgi:hypothetical protein